MANNNWLHRATKQIVKNASPRDMANRFGLMFKDANGKPASNAEWIYEFDDSAVVGFAPKYWEPGVFPDDSVALMDQAARDAVDAAEVVSSRDVVAAELDQLEGVTRALMLAVIDEFNRHSLSLNAILDAIDNATSLPTLKADIALIKDLPQRTPQQLRTMVRNKLGR